MSCAPAICWKRQCMPVLLVEQFAALAWWRAGDSVTIIAARLRRPIPQARAILFGVAP